MHLELSLDSSERDEYSAQYTRSKAQHLDSARVPFSPVSAGSLNAAGSSSARSSASDFSTEQTLSPRIEHSPGESAETGAASGHSNPDGDTDNDSVLGEGDFSDITEILNDTSLGDIGNVREQIALAKESGPSVRRAEGELSDARTTGGGGNSPGQGGMSPWQSSPSFVFVGLR